MPGTFKLKQILVPVDFSGPSELALKHATVLAAHFDGKISLVHVIESGWFAGELSEFDTGLSAIPRRTQERLHMLASRAGELALFDKLEVRTGRPFERIDEAARELGSDLMVISTHGYTGLEYLLLGGTAEKIIRRAPCPVMVVRKKDSASPEPRKILVPIDFSSPSLTGLRYALELGSPFGASVMALHVIEPLGPMMKLEVDAQAYERRRRESTRFKLEELHLEFGKRSDPFETVFREGTPYHEIVGVAERSNFDLIVIASLGQSGLADALLGSTAERVVRHAHCPVLVVRGKSLEQTT